MTSNRSSTIDVGLLGFLDVLDLQGLALLALVNNPEHLGVDRAAVAVTHSLESQRQDSYCISARMSLNKKVIG